MPATERNPFDGTVSASRMKLWRENIAVMADDLWGCQPDVSQKPILDAWVSPALEHRRIALQGPTGNGKTCPMAWCAWHFLLTAGDGVREYPQANALSITKLLPPSRVEKTSPVPAELSFVTKASAGPSSVLSKALAVVGKSGDSVRPVTYA